MSYDDDKNLRREAWDYDNFCIARSKKKKSNICFCSGKKKQVFWMHASKKPSSGVNKNSSVWKRIKQGKKL